MTVKTFNQDEALDLVRRRKGLVQELRGKGELSHPLLTNARHFAYPRKSGLGYADPAAKLINTDGANACATFVISTACKDRDRDVMVPRGCEPTLKNYLSNPRVFWGHQSLDFPIASARDKNGNSTLVVEDERVVATPYFHCLTLESEQVCSLVMARELEATSIGFLPRVARLMERPNSAETGAQARDGIIDFEDGIGLCFLEWDLTEFSIVPIPANPEAVGLWLANGIEGKPLADSLRKSFEPYAPEKKPWSNGFSFEEEDEYEQLRKEVFGDSRFISLHDELQKATLTLNELREQLALSPLPTVSPEEKVSPPSETTPAGENANLPEPGSIPLPPKPSPPTLPTFMSQEQKTQNPGAPMVPPTPAPNPHTGPNDPHRPMDCEPHHPYGLKVLNALKAHLKSFHSYIHELMGPLEHEKLKKHLKKFHKRMHDEHEELHELAVEHYPEHHGMEPKDAADGDPLKSAEIPVTKAPEPPPIPTVVPTPVAPAFDEKAVLEALQALEAGAKVTGDALYQLTGIGR